MFNFVSDGHCWIEIDNFISDISIFRTIYSLDENNQNRLAVENKIGKNNAFLIAPFNLP